MAITLSQLESVVASARLPVKFLGWIKSAGTQVVVNEDTPLPVTSAAPAAGSTSLNTGALNLTSSQVALSTTAGTIAIARATRRSVLIRNLDTAINVYVGPATVTAANGMLIKPGESVPYTWIGLIQGIAASGTPSVAIADEYD